MMICRSILKHFKNIHRTYSSALYITGDKATSNYVVLVPVIDFDSQLLHKDDLKKNISVRGLKINVEELIKRWEFFQDILHRKHNIELARSDLAENILTLINDPSTDPLELNKLRMHSKLLKQDLKSLRDSSYDIEEKTMFKILELPNILHHTTPLDQERVMHTYLEKPEHDSLSHMIIGKELKYLKYLDHLTCYLKSDAALFELKVMNHFRETLRKVNYLQFSNPNFCRSVISEGCDKICHSMENVFTIEETDSNINKLHLCGSATLYSFMAYFSRYFVQANAFPLRYFSIGKVYKPVNADATNNLFNLSQQSAASIFIAYLEEGPDNIPFLVEQISNIYNSLGVHYRVTVLLARDIENSESLRLSIQMYSNFEKKYVEIGNVSFYDNYVSKRLLFTCFSNKEKQYPKVISGTLFNFHKFLGCLLENLDTNLLKEYLKMFSK